MDDQLQDRSKSDLPCSESGDALAFLEQVRSDYQFEKCRRVFESSASWTEPSTKMQPIKSSDTEQPLGQTCRFGRFEIFGHLGQGGFADVFLAYDPALDRRVALKVLP
ncbi:MAG: hypothetical protein R3C03_20110 [Pirellulaceae bacterium]